MKTKSADGKGGRGATSAQEHAEPLDVLLAKIRTDALREMSKALEGDGIERLLPTSLFKRYNLSTDDCHLLERWVTGELIRMIASDKY